MWNLEFSSVSEKFSTNLLQSNEADGSQTNIKKTVDLIQV